MLIRFPQTRALDNELSASSMAASSCRPIQHRKYRPQIAGEVTHRTKNTRDQGVGHLSVGGVSRKCAPTADGSILAFSV
jgi:hypothetical protein